ncbi:hypothetical protein CR513_52036, partial [Mucuna pruriens]
MANTGATENDKQTLRRLATGFFLSGVVLYKRSIDSTFLRCVDSPRGLGHNRRSAWGSLRHSR